MKIINRYSKDVFFHAFSVKETKTQQGMVEPLSKLIQRFRDGRDVPRLAGVVSMSVPWTNSFSSEIVDKFKEFNKFRHDVDSLRDAYEKYSSQNATRNSGVNPS